MSTASAGVVLPFTVQQPVQVRGRCLQPDDDPTPLQIHIGQCREAHSAIMGNQQRCSNQDRRRTHPGMGELTVRGISVSQTGYSLADKNSLIM